MESFFAHIADRWPPGREDYYWLLLPDPGRVLARLAGPYQELTRRPGLAPVPPAWVHVTIQHVAPVDAVTGEEIAKIIGVVRDGCAHVAPFELTVGQAEVWGTGIVTAPDEAFSLLEVMRGPDGSLTRDTVIASTTARKPARSAGPASTQP